MGTTAIIIVLYRPKQLYYQPLAGRENTVVILVDNTPDTDLGLSDGNSIYLPLRANMGIAKAQNVGIAKAKELGCDTVVFFDQDSRPSIALVDQLVSEFHHLKAQGVAVAAVGPAIINQSNGQAYKSKGTMYGDYIETSTIISSGMTTDMDTLTEIGGMEDDLFIDLVDHEWCWRAKSMGMRLFQSSVAQMPHSVGQSSRSFMGFPIIVSAPFRYYYSYRNAFVLMRRSYVPLDWKAKSLVRRIFGLVHIALCGAYSGHRKEIYRNIFKGLKDALHYGK